MTWRSTASWRATTGNPTEPRERVARMPLAPPNYSTLSAMITPAIFMTATGSLIISTSNRMSRIVDRIRQLNELADLLSRGKTDLDFPTERLDPHWRSARTPDRPERRHSLGPDIALPGPGHVRGHEPDDSDPSPDRQRRPCPPHRAGDFWRHPASPRQRPVDTRSAYRAGEQPG